MADLQLLQAWVSPALHTKFSKERERLGWTIGQFMEEILKEALPRWEQTQRPAPKPAKKPR